MWKKDYGFTANYESVVAKAKVKELSEMDYIYGLNKIMAHCGFSESVDSCTTLPYTSVFSLTLYDVNAKKRDWWYNVETVKRRSWKCLMKFMKNVVCLVRIE